MNACRTVEEAEGQAILMGITALSAMYRGSLTIETDCALIVKELEEGSQNRSACFSTICDIRSTATIFNSVSVKVVKRIKNKLAHELAARGRREGDSLIIADVPIELRPLMLSESTM